MAAILNTSCIATIFHSKFSTDHTAGIIFLRFLVLMAVNIMITSNPLEYDV